MAAHRDPSPLPDIQGVLDDHPRRVTPNTPLRDVLAMYLDGEVELVPPTDALDVDMAGWVDTGKTSAYDPNAKYLRATNRNDHSVVERVHLPKEVVAAVSSAVGWDDGYKTNADFIRDAIIHHLWATWTKMGVSVKRDGFGERLEILTLAAIMDQQRIDAAMLRSNIDELDEHVTQALDHNDIVDAKLLLAGYRMMAETIREPYRGQLRIKIERWEERIATRRVDG